MGVGSLSERRFAWLALALYIALGITLMLHHEAWRDEADTWLMARDAPLPDIPMNLGREGNPPLWDFLLLPFARSGFPYETQAVLQLVIACSAAALLFFASPFSRSLKLLTAFSFYMGYEYLAVARPYSLTVLSLFAMAALYTKRFERPIAFALAFAVFVNSVVHALLIGVLIGPLLGWQFLARRRYAPIVIMAVAGAIAGLPMLLAGRNAVVPPVHAPVRAVALEAIAEGFAPSFDILVAVLGVAVFLTASVVIARDRYALAMLWLSWAALMFIYVFVYRGTARHFGLLLMTVLFALWIAGREGRRAARIALNGALYLALALSLVPAVNSWIDEIRYPFSDSKNAAAFLIAEHLERRPIAGHPPGVAEAVLAYLPPRTIWYPAENREGSYMDWRPLLWKANEVPVDVAMEFALQMSGPPDLILVVNKPLTIAGKYRLRLLYKTRERVFGRIDERYWIYGR